jgi:hypothetical protein
MTDHPKYRNTVWKDKENRSLTCEIFIGGEYQQCIVNAGPASEGFVNPDYAAIEDEKKAQEEERAKEQQEVHLNRVKQEALFNIKLEAFEIPIVKQSEEKELKKLIRKAKSPVEVTAYTTILIQRELEKSDD